MNTEAELDYNHIFVGIDGSLQSEHAFEMAVTLAKQYDAHLVIGSIIEHQFYGIVGYSSMNAELLQNESNEMERILAQKKEYARIAGLTEVDTILGYGSPRSVILDEVVPEYHIDLIVIGQSGLSTVERVMMGSVSNHIVLNAPCDVLVIRPDQSEEEH